MNEKYDIDSAYTASWFYIYEVYIVKSLWPLFFSCAPGRPAATAKQMPFLKRNLFRVKASAKFAKKPRNTGLSFLPNQFQFPHLLDNHSNHILELYTDRILDWSQLIDFLGLLVHGAHHASFAQQIQFGDPKPFERNFKPPLLKAGVGAQTNKHHADASPFGSGCPDVPTSSYEVPQGWIKYIKPFMCNPSLL